MKNKKGFTLAELMIVMAILGLLMAAASTLFRGAQASARDSRRTQDLNAISTAVESYYIQNNAYPQPAMKTKSNVWGYVKDQEAKATCDIIEKKDAKGKATGEIDVDAISCGGDIVINKKIVENLKCKFKIERAADPTDTSGTVPTPEEKEQEIVPSDEILEGQTLEGLCMDFYEDDASGLKKSGDKLTIEIGDVKYKEGDTGAKKIVIGWKGTLVLEKSGFDSIFKEEPNKPFNGLKEQANDPKYTDKKYKSSGIGYYPYSVFKDGVGESSEGNRKANMGGTSYQVAATLEKQDDQGNLVPETLIIGNYKNKKSSYPVSLIGSGKNTIINGQVEGKIAEITGMKGIRPSAPKVGSGSINSGIPYPVD